MAQNMKHGTLRHDSLLQKLLYLDVFSNMVVEEKEL